MIKITMENRQKNGNERHFTCMEITDIDVKYILAFTASRILYVVDTWMLL